MDSDAALQMVGEKQNHQQLTNMHYRWLVSRRIEMDLVALMLVPVVVVVVFVVGSVSSKQ